MRYSRQREIVECLVKSTFDHPTADVVYNRAREIEPQISLGTVYRNLKLLADEGAITTLETVDKKIHYDGNTDGHIHFICSNCGKIIDFSTPKNIPQEIVDAGCQVESAKCVYYGLCDDCKI